jgi:hypothetical protein
MKPLSFRLLPLLAAGLCLVRVTSLPLLAAATPAPQWQEVELTFTAARDAANPYTDMTAWLDFQWCQTGHNGEHVPERVADMWRNLPVKAVANGEPTYENIGRTGRGAGWWQGHEAWLNLTAGGTMGVVYGAASLWQWRLHANEPDHADWCTAPNAGWREALDFDGSRYPGIVARIFDGLPLAGMEPILVFTLEEANP